MIYLFIYYFSVLVYLFHKWLEFMEVRSIKVFIYFIITILPPRSTNYSKIKQNK